MMCAPPSLSKVAPGHEAMRPATTKLGAPLFEVLRSIRMIGAPAVAMIAPILCA